MRSLGTRLSPPANHLTICDAASMDSGGARRFFQEFGGDLQVLDEALILPHLGVFVRQPQQVGRMYRHQGFRALWKIEWASAILVDRRDLAEHALRGGC